jgi:hypothetical protein
MHYYLLLQQLNIALTITFKQYLKVSYKCDECIRINKLSVHFSAIQHYENQLSNCSYSLQTDL